MTSNLYLANLTIAQGFNITGAPINGQNGFSVSNAGDVNGDGYADVILCAPFITSVSGNNYISESYVIYGGNSLGNMNLTSLTATQGFSIIQTSTIAISCWSVSGAGDVNKDSFDDVIIGACNTNNYAGVTYVIYGNKTQYLLNIDLNTFANGEVSQGFYIYGGPTGGAFGAAVSGAGDINGDGYDDIIIGAQLAYNSAGLVCIIYGGNNLGNINVATFPNVNGFCITGAYSNYNTGVSVSGAGDVNSDGFGDLIISAPFSGPYSGGYYTSAGISYLIYGGNSLSSIDLANGLTVDQGITIYGANSGDDSGYSVSGAGDINNDGYNDIVIGAPRVNSREGAAYIIFGNKTSILPSIIYLSSLGSYGIYISNALAGSNSGISVSGVGDINNDGYDDIIIGEFFSLPIDTLSSIAYIIYGKKSLTNISLAQLVSSQGFSIYGECSLGQSGQSVSGSGDVNGDGFDDIIIGAPNTNNYTGITYVIYGAASGFATSSPTTAPTVSLAPTIAPTNQPSSQPSMQPNAQPSGRPTSHPTGQPTDQPSIQPSDQPTTRPTGQPSSQPISRPSDQPTTQPSGQPSEQPTSSPSVEPTAGETSMPTNASTPAPTITPTLIPSVSPTLAPTLTPTKVPTSTPTKIPTPIPTARPTTSHPTQAPVPNPVTATVSNIDLNFKGFSISGIESDDYAGYSVKGAGDVNRDGYADLIIGAPRANSYAGISYVIYGSSFLVNIDLANLSPSQGFQIYGTNSGDQSGWSVGGAGDVNNDGYEDVIIGAPYANNGAGISYVVYGPQGGELIANISLSSLYSYQGFAIYGVNSGDESGISVSGAGDVNNDNYDDIIIGAPYASPSSNQLKAGISYVVYGGKNLATTYLASLTKSQGFSISGINPADYSGYSVSGAGDVNNDGYDDVIIGAYYAGISPYYPGASYVIYGGNNLQSVNLATLASNTTLGYSINGYASYSGSGWSVSGAGDINGDRYDDFIIGAPYANGGAGISYVIYGKVGLNNIDLSSLTTTQASTQGFSLYGANLYDYSGAAVSGAGDVNGDGYDDIIIGAPLANNAVGTSYINIGQSTNDNVDLASFAQYFDVLGVAPYDYSGSIVSGAGNLNNDSYTDIIIGAPYANAVYVIFGNENIVSIDLSQSNPNQFYTITYSNGDYIDDFFQNGGLSINAAGDVNNDGYDDIIIGLPYTENFSGASYVIYGQPISTSLENINLANLSSNQGFSIYKAPTNSYSGYSVSGAGDVNGDGIDDIIIGAPNAVPSGIIYIVFGQASSNIANIDLSNLGNKGFSITGAAAGDYAGWSVSSLGNINGDNYNNHALDDIIIGAPFASPNGLSKAGTSYVIFGSNSLTNIGNIDLATLTSKQGFTITGAEAGDQSGWSVSGAENVNNDPCSTSSCSEPVPNGYNDIIIGAPYATVNGLAKAGISYVIFGQPNLQNINLANLQKTQGFSITGAAADDNSGYSVKAAGNVNNDAYADIIIGAPLALNAKGASYVVLGFYETYTLSTIDLASMSSSQGFTITGANVGDQSGFSVSGVGNVNGDSKGYGDVIVGSPYANSNGGISYVILGGASTPSTLPQNTVSPTPQPTSQPVHHTNELEHFVDSPSGQTILGILIPAVVFSVPLYFSKQICFSVLDNWKKDDTSTYINLGKSYVYRACESFFLNSYNQYVVDKKQKQELDANRAFSSDGTNKVEMSDFGIGSQNSRFDIENTQASPLHNQAGSASSSEVLSSGRSETITTQASVNDKIYKSNNQRSCVILSIDASMDPEHVKLQHAEFTEFSDHLMIAYKDLRSVFRYENYKAQILLEDSYTKTDALAIHQKLASKTNVPLSTSDSLMASLFTAKQLIEYLPIIKHLSQNTINYLGYNATLPEVSDYKTLLITAHFTLSSIGMQILQPEKAMNAFVVASIDSSSYAMRFTAVEYLKTQEIADNPIDVLKQCTTTIAAYTLPNIVTCAVTKLALPGTSCALTSYDVLASSSLVAIQCYSNYKAVAQPSEPTTADVVVPYIADALASYMFSSYIGIDTSSTSALMMSIKSSMSAMAAVVAVDSMSKMMMDVIFEEVKSDYIDPVLNCAGDLYTCFTENL